MGVVNGMRLALGVIPEFANVFAIKPSLFANIRLSS